MEISNEDKINFGSLRENNLMLPTDCHKPNLTIQDSYLMYYFGRLNIPQAPSNSAKISNEKNLINSLEKEIISSYEKEKDLDIKSKQAKENLKALNEIHEDETTNTLSAPAKLSGKKSKRQHESLDPLEILNTRDKKGNFVKKEKKTLMQLENKEKVDDPILDQEIELDTNFEESRFESHIHENNQQKQKHEELENNIIEEDLLIPASLRYKKKNK